MCHFLAEDLSTNKIWISAAVIDSLGKLREISRLQGDIMTCYIVVQSLAASRQIGICGSSIFVKICKRDLLI